MTSKQKGSEKACVFTYIENCGIKNGIGEIKNIIFQVGYSEENDADYLWNRITDEKIYIPNEKKNREKYWNTLPLIMDWCDKWAYWIVKLLNTNMNFGLPDIKTVCAWLNDISITILNDTKCNTPETLETVLRNYNRIVKY